MNASVNFPLIPATRYIEANIIGNKQLDWRKDTNPATTHLLQSLTITENNAYASNQSRQLHWMQTMDSAWRPSLNTNKHKTRFSASGRLLYKRYSYELP